MKEFDNINAAVPQNDIETPAVNFAAMPKMKKTGKALIAVKVILLVISVLLCYPVYFAGRMLTASEQCGIATAVAFVAISVLSFAATQVNSKDCALRSRLNNAFSLKAFEITLMIVNILIMFLPLVAFIVLSIALDNFG